MRTSQKIFAAFAITSLIVIAVTEKTIAPVIFGALVISVILTIIAVIKWFAKKRSQELAPLAEKLGMQFNTEKDLGLPEEYKFLNALKNADKCHAKNIFTGTYKGNDLVIFDYNFQRKLCSKTSRYAFSIFIVKLRNKFPKLEITRKDIYATTGQSTSSYNDNIDFNSQDFSKQFCIDSRDNSFAHDVCNTAIIDYLLNKDISIAIEKDVLALTFNRRLNAEDLEHSLDRLIKIRSLMPDYLN